MSSKKGKSSSINIGLNIGGEVCFEKGAVAENLILSILQWPPSLLRTPKKCIQIWKAVCTNFLST